jgi:hypothetical protein
MTDFAYAIARLRRMTVIEWSHAVIGCTALAVLLIVSLVVTP